MKGALVCLFTLALATRASSSNSDPSQAAAICAAEGSDGLLIAHEACNQFYKCSEGKPVALSCQTGLQWNSENEYCDWPDNVKCQESIDEESAESAAPGGGNSDPSEAPKICAEDGSDGVLVAHEECDQFYKCSEGKPVALSCQAGLQWNSDKEFCDWPDNVNCNSKTKESNAANPCASQPSGALVSHEQCSKFYLCNDGTPVALECPDNLLYNPVKTMCDWPGQVDCGDRT